MISVGTWKKPVSGIVELIREYKELAELIRKYIELADERKQLMMENDLIETKLQDIETIKRTFENVKREGDNLLKEEENKK
ncbi:hypothetical protein KAX97_15180 [candidate division WOR-3 bacterium]|nr:hypothetical protein [Candidatus Omnitrophota bacterium]MCK4252788.1 hypothetical protein [candidate division WOR-3 bacterium]